MINDLSESLRALLSQPGLPRDLAAAQIAFDRPSDTFKPAQTTIDLFAYALREDRTARRNLPGSGNEQGIRHIACSYLITAWPVGGAELALQEQQLLGDVLQVLMGYPAIPAAFLRGKLAGQEAPRLMVLHPDADGGTSEFWTALGNRLRPSLGLIATIAVPAFQPPPS
jgi:hypothetical protein